MKVSSNTAANQEVLDKINGSTGDSQNLPSVRAPQQVGVITGDVSEAANRIQFPSLKLIHGTSKSEFKTSPGAFVLGDDHLLALAGEPLIITFAKSAVYWKEYVDAEKRKILMKEQRTAKTWPSKEAAQKDGFITDWPPYGKEGPRPNVSEASYHEILIQKPEKLECALFGFELGGKLWTPARWFLDKGAHTDVVRALMAALRFSLASRKPEYQLVAGQYKLASCLKTPKGGGDAYQAPKVALHGSHSDADCEKILAAFGGTAVIPDSAVADD